MYVVTFYSYKGGVGRTMALINVAAELAQRGRRVLIVDFDLEAPGLATFPFCREHSGAKGIVDYVTEYSETLKAPQIVDYLQKCTMTASEREIGMWVMSAGRQDNHYKERFYSINWDTLYREQSGFLMIENLKEQWQDAISPDYVFIDSRTGHTDISGICTRQLPDAVVFTFFPNDQNLAGLSQVVSEVREEGGSKRRKRIHMHFAASNVPDIDDVDGILRDHLARFKNELGYKDHSLIRYYNSTAIVEQDIFTISRPKTRLAKEYQALTNEIIRANSDDRDGALAYLDDVIEKYRKDRDRISDLEELERKLNEIKTAHPTDFKILGRLGEILYLKGSTADAIRALEESVKGDDVSADVLRLLAILYRQSHRDADAKALLLRLVEKPASPWDIHYVVFQLIDIDESAVPSVLQSNAARSLDVNKRVQLTNILRSRRSLVPYAITLLDEVIEDSQTEEVIRSSAKHNKILCEIAIGQFGAVLSKLGSWEAVSASGKIENIFNFAVADWGVNGIASKEKFGAVLAADRELPAALKTDDDPNYAQCLSIAAFEAGDRDGAFEWLAAAKNRASRRHNQGREFSCWSYLDISVSQFVDELEQMKDMFSGNPIEPAVLASCHRQ